MGEVGSALDVLTFLMAWLGYVSVTVAMLARYSGSQHTSRWAAPFMLAIVSLHVFLVWSVRSEFDPGNAASTGALGTFVLYTIYLLIIVHTVGHRNSALAGRLVYPAWILVTLAGTPSTFMLPYLAWLRVPMVLTLVVGIVGLVVIRERQVARSVLTGDTGS